jgi:hypothetical protein
MFVEGPATDKSDVGGFQKETMAFPLGVTVADVWVIIATA